MNPTAVAAVEPLPVPTPTDGALDLVTVDVDVTRADEPGVAPTATSPAHGAELPARIGRYVVVDRIGAGGMGVVVAAYDAGLDRSVAIKLLHPRSRGLNAAARLVREAQALARLSHPNVVAIYDAGTIDGHTFIAMELVAGRTLGRWLREGARGWREVLAMFLGAAAGLAAAHSAGIVHRDFKPDNVLVGEDGRPRVLDFGLAVERGEDSGDRLAAASMPAAMSSTAFGVRLTASGMVMGTPAYMAPEQLRGAVADARSDQYSFCVALWEAMFGERPRHDVRDTARPATAPARAPGAPGGPAWLRRVLQRGLAPDPAARWPSMEALGAALTRHGRRRGRVGLTTAAALVAGALAWRSANGDVGDHCERARDRTLSAWDDAQHERVRVALAATGLGYAEVTWQRIAPELDAYIDEAAALRVSSCDVADAEADAIRTCLDHREAAFAAVVDVLTQTDATTLERAGAVVAGLPRLATCVDPVALADELPLPTAPDQRDEARQLREGLLTVGALRDARRFADGMTLARALLDRARLLGYRPLVAEAQLAVGSLLELTGDDRAAEILLDGAAMIARAEGQDRVATIAMTRLTGAVGYRLARVDEGRAWARHAQAMVGRARLDVAERAQLVNNIGAVEFRAGDYLRAEELYRQAVALVGEPDDPRQRQELANAHNNLGNVLARQGRFADAAIELEQSLAILTELLGPEHPTVAMAMINLGNVKYDLGQYAEAGAYHHGAYTVVRASVGDEHPLVAASLGNLGLVMHRLGRDPEARGLLEDAIALKRRLVGDDHPDIAFAMNNLGEVYRELGLGELALAQHDAAGAIWARHDPDHPYAAYPLANRGLDLLVLGRNDEALAALREAKTICDAQQADPSIIAATQFGIAQALVLTGGSRVDALAQARAAEQTYDAIGGRYDLERDAIRRWLRGQGPAPSP